MPSLHKPPSARDIPPVTLSDVPQVDAAEFQAYLARFGSLYEQLRTANGGGSELKDVSHGWSDEGDQYSPHFHKAHRRSSQRPSLLSTIPPVYFNEKFHLENPRVFDIVTERSEISQTPSPRIDATTSAGRNTAAEAAPRKALATNAILQEKLSWYMDTVEAHLIVSSFAASSTFFAVLSSLQGLGVEAIDSAERIKGLRQELQSLDEAIAGGGLTVIKKRQRRENLRRLHDAVLQLKHIVVCFASCENLVDNGEPEKAL